MHRVLVVYASRHGATRGIALRIGKTLEAEGFATTILPAHEAPHPMIADAVVIGSATYMGKWLDEAAAYVQEHHKALAGLPTWLFSSGPVGTESVDKQGRSVLEDPTQVREFAAHLLARGTRVFFGRWDPSDPPASLAERLFRLMPVSRELLPIGDFRDWDAIDGWARAIAHDLRSELAATEPVTARAGA